MNAAALPNIAIRYADSTYTQYLNLRNYLKDTRPGVWHSVSIPLKDFGLNAVNDTNIKKLAAVALRPGTADGNEYTIYLDDIELLPASLPSVSTLNAPVLQEAKAYERHIDIKWIPQSKEDIKYYRIYRSFDGITYQPVAVRRPWMNRYTDFLGEVGKRLIIR